jgi:predicted DNA-binding antitoxin AbrB/MazE fold protein
MPIQVDAIYEHGMLRPLQPLDLPENEVVVVTITPAASRRSDRRYLAALREAIRDAGPAPGLDEVRRRLSKIPGTLTADFIVEREDR